MALFSFKKKEAPAKQPQQEQLKGIPTDLVIQMRIQGLSNNQIIQNLQRMRYKSSDIFDAMNQADIKGSIEAAPMEPMSPEDVENPIQPMMYGSQQFQYQYPQQPMPQEPQQAMPPQMRPVQQPSAPFAPQQAQQAFTSHERVEELVESVIDEKWASISGEISKVVDWKNKMDAKIAALEQDLKDLRSSFDQLHQAVVGKVGEYDQHILNVGAEIKAMERVFQKVLPSLTENVGELGRITEELKGTKEKVAKK